MVGESGNNKVFEDDEPLYTIGVVSRMLNCDPSTLRRYESAGLVNPGRTEGNTRLYSNRNVETLRTVHRLIDQEKLNVHGVRKVLELEREIEKLKARVRELEERLRTADSRGEKGRDRTP
ncbi:MAG: MerR family transcriptional regulator [Actinobacteria bacterium]|nr:MerR family transcriptional regulator [Actinomycetota bacterium]